LDYLPLPNFSQQYFFILPLVANFHKLVGFFGGKLENNEISKKKFEGGHYLFK
jgi:hypothetical protein